MTPCKLVNKYARFGEVFYSHLHGSSNSRREYHLLQIEPTWCTNFLIMFIAYLYMFRATVCPSSEKIPYLCDTWYLSLYIDDCLVCKAEWIPPCIPDSHLYRVTNTRCRVGTVCFPADGHIVAWNMYRKAINILRKFMHHVGSIYKILYKDAR